MSATTAAAASKSQLAYSWIRERIDKGHFVPGYRLVIGQLAKELKVSTVPVREAIRRLEAEGLVTFEPNVGAQVALIHESEYRYAMEALGIVEGAATALSAPSITADHIARGRAINRRMTECLDDFEPRLFTELNRQFHSVLFEQCPNPHILDQVHRGWTRLTVLRDSTFGFVPGRARQSVEEHEQLLQLIERHADARAIEFAARNHRLNTLDAMLVYQAEHKHPQQDTLRKGTR